MTDVSCKTGLPECVSGTMETYATYPQTSDSIERYNQSPQLYRKSTTFKIEEEEKRPDIIASKICTELDLVASHAPSIIITPEESINQILTKSQDWPAITRIVPEGRDVIIESSEITSDSSGDKLDGMLDRISHDLDYLLNRSDKLPVSVVNNRKKSVSIQEEVIEEETEDEVKVPEAITDILRTNC